MKNPANKLARLIAVVIALIATSIAHAQYSDLLAHGTDDVFWVAQVVSASDGKQRREQTILRARGIGGGETRWVEVARLNDRVIELAGRGSDVVTLLSTRDWLVLWGNGQMTGPSLPNGSMIQTIASDRDSIWAIAIVGSPQGAATTTATTQSSEASSPASVTTLPATTNASAMRTAPGDLALYQLDRGNWVWKSGMPSEMASSDVGRLAMTVVGGYPLISMADADGVLHTYQYGSDNQWIPRGTVTPAGKGPIKLVNAGQAVLWEGGANGAGSIHVLGEKWSQAIPLKVSVEVRQPEARTIAAVSGNLRFLFLDNGKIFEQPFKTDGTSLGSAAELVMPSGNPNPYSWPMVVLVMALLLALAGAVFRRRAPAAKEE
jgi:hypothetical protein